MSHFGKGLAKKLGIQQNLSTAFHPQTDSLSERKNQWVEQYLRLVTSAVPKDWTQWLALASTVHNNWKNSTTSLSPNQVLLGYDILLNLELISPVTNETVEEHVKLIEQWQAQATVAVKTYYCLWQAVGNDLMFEVEVIDPKDYQRDVAKED